MLTIKPLVSIDEKRVKALDKGFVKNVSSNHVVTHEHTVNVIRMERHVHGGKERYVMELDTNARFRNSNSFSLSLTRQDMVDMIKAMQDIVDAPIEYVAYGNDDGSKTIALQHNDGVLDFTPADDLLCALGVTDEPQSVRGVPMSEAEYCEAVGI